jgi:predicted DCC family thiol-disulfide oxidoreductase YuxK
MSSNITLIFDGDCGFCTTVANRIVKLSKTRIVAVPWQFADLRQFSLTQAEVADRVYLAIDDQNFGGHEAFAMVFRVQPNSVLRFMGKIMMSRNLRWASMPMYRLVARYRHKLPGGTPACKLPRP